MKTWILAAALACAGERARAAEAQATAEVVKIDKLDGSVMIRDERGETMKLAVPPEVQDLDGLRTGLRLRIRYQRAAAEAIAKPAALPAASEESFVVPGGKPAGRARYVLGRVLGKDLVRRELKLEGPDGETISLDVGPGVAGFENVKVGDAAAVRFLEATALVVTRASLSQP